MHGILFLHPRTVVWSLFSVIAVLTLAHLAGKVSTIYLGHDTLLGLVPMFDLNREHNLPTFFASLALLSCAVLFGVATAARWHDGKGERLYWLALLLVFVFLAYDELFQVHERLTRPTQAALGMSSKAYFAWTIPMGVATSLFGLLFLRFVLRLPPRIRTHFVVAGALYVTGALGMELLGGTIDRDPHNLLRVLVNTLEEVLEMTGIVVLIGALLLYLEQMGVALSFGDARKNGRPNTHVSFRDMEEDPHHRV